MASKIILGIDIGGTNVKIGTFDISMELLEQWEVPTDISDKGNNLLQSIYNFLTKRIAFEDVAGVGIAVPGVVNNSVVGFASNIGWENYNVQHEFAEITGLDIDQICVINDVNAATLCESKLGAGKDYQSTYMITLGTGIGGGYVYNNQLLTGSHGFLGEVGHIYVSNPHQKKCGCGNKGCVETIASATGINNLALKYYKEELNAKEIFSLFAQNDDIAVKIVTEVSSYLAELLHTIVLVLDPDIIVIGGGVANAGTLLTDNIRKQYQKKYGANFCDINIDIAAFQNDAGIYGSALMCLMESTKI